MAIVVPQPGQDIDATLFGAPVANQLNAIAPTAWTALSLLSGYTNEAGFRAARYRKIGDIVYVEGTLSSPGTVTVTVFQLPAGFRPLVNLRVYGASHKTAVGGVFPWRGLIDTNGNFAFEEVQSLTSPITVGIILNFSTI